MVVRIGAFRPFRGMAVLFQLPDDRGITNAKVGVGTKLATRDGSPIQQIFWLRWNAATTIGLHVWPDLPFRIQSTKNLLKPLSLLLANARGSPTTSHLRRAAACLLSRESSPHPIPAAGPPSMETPPSVTRRRPTGGRQATPRVSSRIQCVTLPAISGVRQLPVGIPSQVVKRTHSIEVTRESSLC